jgi:fructose-1,6-bisphosphatase/inositol monophosphatase family enzyme
MPTLTNRELQTLTSLEYMGKLIWNTQKLILKTVLSNPDAFKTHWVSGASGKKPMAWVDAYAENTFIDELHERFPRTHVRVLGEESLEDAPVLDDEDKVCVLVDMLDGTDLVQRDFGNWCSAAVVYTPRRRIEAAYVAVRSSTRNTFYYSLAEGGRPKKFDYSDDEFPKSRATAVAGPNANTRLEDATVCSYGQKAFGVLNLMSVGKSEAIRSWLSEKKDMNASLKETAAGELGFRFYNLAGNPMMARLADGVVDLVFELGGQLPHDVVPGAFLAHKAGAHVQILNEDPGSAKTLDDCLLKPASTKLKYIVSASKTLTDDFMRAIARDSIRPAPSDS